MRTDNLIPTVTLVTITVEQIEEIKKEARELGYQHGYDIAWNDAHEEGYEAGYEDATAAAEESRAADVAVGVRAC